jgi:formylglycine-generating enzyme required for sulfatase activity/predicted Ser/Thr protein kinase
VGVIAEGAIIGGFQIERLLGKGGMGEVYLARQLSLNRPVALKVLTNDKRLNTGMAGRFLQEMQALARLDHPNIVTAYEAGEYKDVLYLAMAYVKGESLEDRIAHAGRIYWQEACGLVKKLANALAYAWDEHRILHRDIKPSNVLLDGRGEPKLTDLGLVKSLALGPAPDSPPMGLTLAGAVIGTPNYMSPEQADGHADLDFRSDMYSLGATLYHMITGKMPFQGSSLMATLRKQATENLPDPRQYAPDIPEGIVVLLEIMLAKNPNQRHANWAELQADVQRVLEGQIPCRARPETGKTMLVRLSENAEVAVKPASEIRSRLKPPLVAWAATGTLAAVLLGLGIWAMANPVMSLLDNIRAEHSSDPGGTPPVGPGNNFPPAKTVQVDLGAGATLDLVWVQSGEFAMGSPANEECRQANETRHKVTITKGYWMGKCEVTQAQWERVVGTNANAARQPKRDLPVVQVSWEDCQEFLKKLNTLADNQNSKPGRGAFRLPTEAEWEYACRAGSQAAFTLENAEATLDRVGWYGGNAGGAAHAVGQKQANAWGLYDMQGNVWEWCQDWYEDYPGGDAKNPAGPAAGAERILRGGSWRNNSERCRSAYRYAYDPTDRNNHVGFRVVFSY